MGLARRFSDHTIIGHAIPDKVRDPQLIKLPIPLPSIPVLTPLLSPVVGGSNNNEDTTKDTTTTTTTTAAAAAAATSAAASAPASSSSGGNSSGSNTSTGSSGSNSSGGDSGSSSSSKGSTSSSSGDAPSSGDTSSVGTSSDTTTTSTGDSPTTSGGTSAGKTGSTTSSGVSTSNSKAVNDDATGVGGSVVPGSSSGTGGTGSSNEGTSSGGIANAGSIPGASSSAGSGTSGTSITGTHSISGAGYPSSTNGAAGGGTDSGNNGASQRGTNHGLSGATIAAIVVVLVVILLGGFICFVRKRSRARRDERASRWWFSKYRSSESYGDQDSETIWATGRQSARSSFATTVDQSIIPYRSSSSDVIPPLPPMAEVGRANGSAPMLILDTTQFASINGQIDNRFSMGSGHSGQSENSQYLLVRNRDSLDPEFGTPMSVRPFSPSESFAFPKPPDPAGDRTSAYSRSASLSISSRPSSTFAMMKTPINGSFQASRSVPPTPALPPVAISSVDPFSDNNPFDDPAVAVNAAGEFSETEFIRRPFHPSLPDELAVRPDDPVHVLQAFDDGWALVSKVQPDDGNGKGNGANTAVKHGLIPLDCLREPGQDLTTFIAAKRVSSYAESVRQGTYSAI